MTKQEFASILAPVAIYFGATGLNAFMLDKYFKHFEGYKAEEFAKACELVEANYPYKNGLPLIAVFKEALAQVISDLELRAINALNLAKRTAQSLGDGKSVYFSSRALSNTISLFGGWVAFCNADWSGGTGIANERKFIELFKLVRHDDYLRDIYHKGIYELRNGYTDTDNEGRGYTPVAQVSEGKAISYVKSEHLLAHFEGKELNCDKNPLVTIAKAIVAPKRLNFSDEGLGYMNPLADMTSAKIDHLQSV